MEAQGHPFRLQREKLLTQSFFRDGRSYVPPPYQLRDIDMIYLLCSFDPIEARKVLPAGLELSDPVQGTISIYSTALGRGLAPYTACFFGLQVQGFDSAPGWPAQYLHAVYCSAPAVDIFNHLYNDLYLTGSSRRERGDDDAVYGECLRADGLPILKIRATANRGAGLPLSGLNNYMGRIGQELSIYSVAYNCQFQDLSDVRIEVTDHAPESLQRLQPLNVIWPLHIENMDMTFGVPSLISERSHFQAQRSRTVLLDVFGRLGRAAAIIGVAGQVIHLNGEAERLLGDGITLQGGRLRASDLSSQKALDDSLTVALQGERLGAPVALARHDSMAPLIAHALPVDPIAAGQPAALLLLTDPAETRAGDATRTLQLMGLTPAESRLASLVGGGQSPREAAEHLQITESTARSALRSIYDKLSISRQAELAKIVVRLETV